MALNSDGTLAAFALCANCPRLFPLWKQVCPNCGFSRNVVPKCENCHKPLEMEDFYCECGAPTDAEITLAPKTINFIQVKGLPARDINRCAMEFNGKLAVSCANVEHHFTYRTAGSVAAYIAYLSKRWPTHQRNWLKPAIRHLGIVLNAAIPETQTKSVLQRLVNMWECISGRRAADLKEMRRMCVEAFQERMKDQKVAAAIGSRKLRNAALFRTSTHSIATLTPDALVVHLESIGCLSRVVPSGLMHVKLDRKGGVIRRVAARKKIVRKRKRGEEGVPAIDGSSSAGTVSENDEEEDH